MKLEICIDNIEDVNICNKYSNIISRIELNHALDLGGLTPTIELVKKVREKLDKSIKLVCMIRTRAGDFCYTDLEFEVMYNEALSIIDYCDGLVFGALNKDNTINIEKTKKIIDICHKKGKEFVFHRAIDVVKDYFNSIKILEDLNVDRILTSGHEETAIKGLVNLKKIDANLEILAGCGITPDNCLNFKGFQVHGSFSKNILTSFGSYKKTDEKKIKDLFETKLFEK